MSRIIEFRAWDNSTKKMYYRTGLTVSNNSIIHMDGEVMQFTGVRDRYKNEIFESDIIMLNGFEYIVKWHDDNACFFLEPTDNKCDSCGFDEVPANHLEKIGNIYES